jgi:DNA-binding CsgD family transcriptional regulator
MINFREPSVSFVTTPITVNHDELKKIASLYFYEHPIAQYYLETGDDTAHKISDFLSESQLYRLEGLYQKFLRPLCMEDKMILVVQNSSKTTTKNRVSRNQDREVVIVALNRPKRDFCERDRLILNLLRPHLYEAYRNATAISQMQQELTQLNKTVEQLGTIILTGDLKVKLMTKRAWELLTQYFRLSSCTKTHLPDNLLRWVKHRISQLNQSDEISFPCSPLQLEQEGKRLVVRLVVEQPREQYLLLLEEHLLHSLNAELLQLLDLTKREAEVLYWVAQDKSDKEIGLILNLCTGTVKKHLEHIYQKLGVQTRIAAVMYALKALGMLNC